MTTPKFRVLFVDDEPRLLDGLRRAMHGHRAIWDSSFAVGGVEALADLGRTEADVVVTDMRMPGIDGATLLEHVARLHPGTIRIILSGQSNRDSALRTAHLAHRFLAKPVATPALHATIAALAAVRGRFTDPCHRAFAGGIAVLPVTPPVYAELWRSLDDPLVNLSALARCVERDAALCAKILQLVNSAFFAQAIETASIDEALRVLGPDVLRLFLNTEAVRRAASLGQPPEVDAEQQRSATAARIARQIASPGSAADASMAALLGGLGRLALAAQPDEDSADATGLTNYLLGIWGLPAWLAITEASNDLHVEAA